MDLIGLVSFKLDMIFVGGAKIYSKYLLRMEDERSNSVAERCSAFYISLSPRESSQGNFLSTRTLVTLPFCMQVDGKPRLSQMRVASVNDVGTLR